MRQFVNIQYQDLELCGILQYPEHDRNKEDERVYRRPIVIICHGFVSNKIGVDRLFVDIANELVANGFLVLRFDYAGCGDSQGDYGSGGLDKLVEQTKCVLDYVSTLASVDHGNIYLLGHSLGGAVSLLTAAQDSRVRKLILYAPVAYPDHDILEISSDEAIRKLKSVGYTEYQSYVLTERFIETLRSYHPLHELKRFQGDVLIVHGTSDQVIPVNHCFLYEKMFWLRKSGSCRKEVILNADHTFTSKNSRQDAIKKTAEWLLNIHQQNESWSHWEI